MFSLKTTPSDWRCAALPTTVYRVPASDFTRWTIHLALVAYAGRLACNWVLPNASARTPLARWLWTAACFLLWLHVACAFHVHHGWSHDAAWEATARDTARVTGIDWGGGLWFNYALLALWTADVLGRWIAPQHHAKRPRALEVGWQLFVAFMVLNATVVFAQGAIRWIAVLATGGLALAWLGLRKRDS